jgi:hypothetical protein
MSSIYQLPEGRTFELLRCECGGLFERTLGRRGQPVAGHPECTRLRWARDALDKAMDEARTAGRFGASEPEREAQRALRSWLWSTANTLNDTPGCGGAARKKHKRKTR